jgi:hypothetical protein
VHQKVGVNFRRAPESEGQAFKKCHLASKHTFYPNFAAMIKKTFFKISVKKGLGWGVGGGGQNCEFNT